MLRTALEKQTLLVAFLGYLWELVGELLSTLFSLDGIEACNLSLTLGTTGSLILEPTLHLRSCYELYFFCFQMATVGILQGLAQTFDRRRSTVGCA